MSSELRKSLEQQTSYLSDYARFDVVVDEVLVGKAPKTFSVTWDNSTFGEPETLPSGPYVIALRDPAAAMPPIRGPSATIVANPDPGTLTLLQAPCSSPFMFESTSEEAAAVRKLLPGLPKQ